MSHVADIENVLRTIAAAAEERRPLPPELRARCGTLGTRIAEGLDAGQDVATALAGHIPEDLRAALRGPRPPLERSALLAAERLRMERIARLAWLDAIAHPIMTVCGVAIAMLVIVHYTGHGLAFPALITGLAMLVAGACAMWVAWSRHAVRLVPSLASLGYHVAQAQRFERAALVARWRLPETELLPILGSDWSNLGAVLSHPDAENHCRRLADYHATAAVRSRRHLARILAAIVYVAAGALLVSAAIEPMGALVDAMCAIGDSE
ncbi:MAG: hypothetical protein H0W83_08150 [Planctomycetes bacterium]|nr:hypothetical protein [Planctomycetota bacterium]